MDYIIGIDPGLNGAIAVIQPDGTLFTVHDMPTVVVENKKGKKKRSYDLVKLAEILAAYKGVKECALEAVHAFSGQGVTSTFNFGMGFGIIQGVLASNSIPFTLVYPQSWKKAMGITAGAPKSASLILARHSFPLADLRLAKHDGRAEALLLAEYHRLRNLALSLPSTKDKPQKASK